jgi:hypothetical protein
MPLDNGGPMSGKPAGKVPTTLDEITDAIAKSS